MPRDEQRQTSDPFLEEVHRLKRESLECSGNDLARHMERLRELEKHYAHRMVGPPAQPATLSAHDKGSSMPAPAPHQRWPFADPKSLAVITLKRIVKGPAPVLYVVRDDEGGWQFLDGDDCAEDDAAIVGLDEIIAHDATLRELAALPPGFYAVRETINGPWHIGWAGGEEDDERGEDEPPQ